jgi:hypothetical protein
MGSFAVLSAVRSYMAIRPDESSQSDLNLPAIALGPQMHSLILEPSPSSFHQDVFKATLSPAPANLNALFGLDECGLGRLLAFLLGAVHHYEKPLSTCSRIAS